MDAVQVSVGAVLPVDRVMRESPAVVHWSFASLGSIDHFPVASKQRDVSRFTSCSVDVPNGSSIEAMPSPFCHKVRLESTNPAFLGENRAKPLSRSSSRGVRQTPGRRRLPSRGRSTVMSSSIPDGHRMKPWRVERV
jgi:hypothetical protein